MAFCTNCGAPVSDGARFCPSCGAAVGPGPDPAAAPPRPVAQPLPAPAQPASGTSGSAIASLVFGIAGFFVFPVIPSIMAIVFGYAARREIAQKPGLGGEGFATAGIVLGWIGAAIWAFGVLVFLVVLASFP
jgi:hypothetical protein